MLINLVISISPPKPSVFGLVVNQWQPTGAELVPRYIYRILVAFSDKMGDGIYSCTCIFDEG